MSHSKLTGATLSAKNTDTWEFNDGPDPRKARVVWDGDGNAVVVVGGVTYQPMGAAMFLENKFVDYEPMGLDADKVKELLENHKGVIDTQIHYHGYVIWYFKNVVKVKVYKKTYQIDGYGIMYEEKNLTNTPDDFFNKKFVPKVNQEIPMAAQDKLYPPLTNTVPGANVTMIREVLQHSFLNGIKDIGRPAPGMTLNLQENPDGSIVITGKATIDAVISYVNMGSNWLGFNESAHPDKEQGILFSKTIHTINQPVIAVSELTRLITCANMTKRG
jgi:hypothetical protein